MKNILKEITTKSIIISIVVIIFAALLIANPVGVMHTALIILGIISIALGVLSLVKYSKTPQELKFFNTDLLFGVIALVIGFVFLVMPDKIIQLIFIVAGIWIIFEGVSRLQLGLNLRDKISKGWWLILVAVLEIIAGVFVLCHPKLTAASLVQTSGIVLLIVEIVNIIQAVVLNIKLTEFDDVTEEKNKPHTEEKTEVKIEVEPEEKPEVKIEVEPEETPETTVETEPEEKHEVKIEVEPEESEKEEKPEDDDEDDDK